MNKTIRESLILILVAFLFDAASFVLYLTVGPEPNWAPPLGIALLIPGFICIGISYSKLIHIAAR